jgi:2-polyprenyl-3-methyl-5-hydroxy-6-metoxy-1,4-benzoquinol methylase
MFASEIKAGTPLRWLDVGAGYGEMIEGAKQALPPQSTVFGIEPMEPKARDAQSRGLPIEAKLLSDVHEQYDVISLINVFSHIPDFRQFSAELSKRLVAGGVLFLETGNGGDLESREAYPGLLYLPDHLIFVGVNQMTSLLESIGFEIEDVRKYRVDGIIFCLKELVKSMLARRHRCYMPYMSPFRTVLYKARKRKDLWSAP